MELDLGGTLIGMCNTQIPKVQHKHVYVVFRRYIRRMTVFIGVSRNKMVALKSHQVLAY